MLDAKLGEVLARLPVGDPVSRAPRLVAFDKVVSREVNNWQLRRWKVARSGRAGTRPLLRLVSMLLIR